jgi:hypothetical protein
MAIAMQMSKVINNLNAIFEIEIAIDIEKKLKLR